MAKSKVYKNFRPATLSWPATLSFDSEERSTPPLDMPKEAPVHRTILHNGESVTLYSNGDWTHVDSDGSQMTTKGVIREHYFLLGPNRCTWTGSTWEVENRCTWTGSTWEVEGIPVPEISAAAQVKRSNPNRIWDPLTGDYDYEPHNQTGSRLGLIKYLKAVSHVSTKEEIELIADANFLGLNMLCRENVSYLRGTASLQPAAYNRGNIIVALEELRLRGHSIDVAKLERLRSELKQTHESKSHGMRDIKIWDLRDSGHWSLSRSGIRDVLEAETDIADAIIENNKWHSVGSLSTYISELSDSDITSQLSNEATNSLPLYLIRRMQVLMLEARHRNIDVPSKFRQSIEKRLREIKREENVTTKTIRIWDLDDDCNFSYDMTLPTKKKVRETLRKDFGYEDCYSEQKKVIDNIIDYNWWKPGYGKSKFICQLEDSHLLNIIGDDNINKHPDSNELWNHRVAVVRLEAAHRGLIDSNGALIYSRDEAGNIQTINQDNSIIHAPENTMSKVIKASKKGMQIGGAMIAQDAMNDLVTKLAGEIGVPVEIVAAAIKDNPLAGEVLNILVAGGAMAGADAFDQHKIARFISAGAEAALTGRVAYATHKHGGELRELAQKVLPELVTLARAGSVVLDERMPELPEGWDVHENAEEKEKSKAKVKA